MVTKNTFSYDIFKYKTLNFLKEYIQLASSWAVNHILNSIKRIKKENFIHFYNNNNISKDF
jgi:hypothetical protein